MALAGLLQRQIKSLGRRVRLLFWIGSPVRKQDKDQAARIVLIDNFNHKALDDLLFGPLPQVVRRAASPIPVVESEPRVIPPGHTLFLVPTSKAYAETS